MTEDETMTSRERVLKALNHEEPDRIPIDCGGDVCAMSQFAYRKVVDHLGLDLPVEITDVMQQLARIDEPVRHRLGADIVHFGPGVPDHFCSQTIASNPATASLPFASGSEQHAYRDEWGIVWRRAAYYYDMIHHPLQEAQTVADIERYPWPDPKDPGRFRGLDQMARGLHGETDYAVLIDQGSGGILEMSLWMRGFEAFFTDLASGTAVGEAILDKILEYLLEFFDAYLDAVGPYTQIVGLSDDFGMQHSMLISPAVFRRSVKPRYGQLLALVKRKAPHAKTFHHSCGAIVPIIDDLIEIGVDILNPVQPQARGMDSWELKRRYGHDIVFHGGIDEQYVLDRGTPQEVEEEVKRRLDAFGPGGGYILAPAHNIQANVSLKNILALYDAARRWGAYPINVGPVTHWP
jgi:uroporphyrinogen decarboxylase